MSNDLLKQFSHIFKRISLDEIDIIVRGEVPKHKHFIYLEDVQGIINVIRESTEEEAIDFIAKKIKTIGRGID